MSELLDRLCDKCLKQPRNLPTPANTVDGIPSPALLCGSCKMELQMWQSWFARGGLKMIVTEGDILASNNGGSPESDAKARTSTKT